MVSQWSINAGLVERWRNRQRHRRQRATNDKVLVKLDHAQSCRNGQMRSVNPSHTRVSRRRARHECGTHRHPERDPLASGSANAAPPGLLWRRSLRPRRPNLCHRRSVSRPDERSHGPRSGSRFGRLEDAIDCDQRNRCVQIMCAPCGAKCFYDRKGIHGCIGRRRRTLEGSTPWPVTHSPGRIESSPGVQACPCGRASQLHAPRQRPSFPLRSRQWSACNRCHWELCGSQSFCGPFEPLSVQAGTAPVRVSRTGSRSCWHRTSPP